ncbi:MAG: TIGR03435 family protein [Acidobacteriota bacterium]|nr:TIGR03435 family protein [Acidobacteriota bacterium]
MLSVVFLVTALLNLDAQTESTANQKFEVASVRLCQNGQSPSGGDPNPGRLHLACVTTANLIRLAYLVFPTGQPNAPVSPNAFQMPISGAPSWLDSDRYAIDATVEQRVNTEMMKGPMMQALLEERFGLKLHKETKVIPAFELKVGKKGTKLQPAKEGACVVYDRNNPPSAPSAGQPAPIICGVIRESARGGFDILGATMPDLCRQLSAYVDRDIVDKTGITGAFDVHLDLLPADLGYGGATPDPSSASTPDDGGAIAAAVKKLGLKMSNAKQSAQFLVIDHVERPSEN